MREKFLIGLKNNPDKHHTGVPSQSHPDQRVNDHLQRESKPVISRTWQAGTVAGNLLIGAAEIATGNLTTLSVTGDGIHNVGDGFSYGLETENVLNPKLTEEKILKRRRVAHTIISAGSLIVATKAGIELNLDADTSHNPITVYASGASLALNAMLMNTLYRGIQRRSREGTLKPQERDLVKHLLAIDIPSAALAVVGAVAGIVAQRLGINEINTIEQAAAIATGTIGAIAFRPTRKNLDHNNCAKHGHHDHKPHNKNGRRTRRGIAIALAGATLLGGFALGNRSTNESPPEVPRTTPIAGPQIPQEELEEKQKPSEVTPSTTITLLVKSGDTIWEMSRNNVHNTGCEGTDTQVANQLPYILALNQGKDLDKITIGEQIVFPQPVC
ncbi:MAG: hypothetical protein AAB553_04700 [Patescibacteria group bacterium]